VLCEVSFVEQDVTITKKAIMAIAVKILLYLIILL